MLDARAHADERAHRPSGRSCRHTDTVDPVGLALDPTGTGSTSEKGERLSYRQHSACGHVALSRGTATLSPPGASRQSFLAGSTRDHRKDGRVRGPMGRTARAPGFVSIEGRALYLEAVHVADEQLAATNARVGRARSTAFRRAGPRGFGVGPMSFSTRERSTLP
jgi:hypothetical protein